MKKSKKLGFTLVEIVIVIILLAILMSIAFYSYINHVKGARDSSRIGEITEIGNGLGFLKVGNILPYPANYIKVVASGAEVGFQGYLSQDILNIIGYNENGKDPLEGFYYTYYITKDLKLYQLLTYLEDPQNLDSFNFIDKTFALTDYSIKFPKVYGDKLGVLTTLDNIPVQEDNLIKNTKIIDIVKTLIPYKAYFTDSNYIQGTGGVLYTANPNSSCRRIIETKGGVVNSKFIINPYGEDQEIYCNSNYMDTNFTGAEFLPSTL